MTRTKQGLARYTAAAPQKQTQEEGLKGHVQTLPGWGLRGDVRGDGASASLLQWRGWPPEVGQRRHAGVSSLGSSIKIHGQHGVVSPGGSSCVFPEGNWDVQGSETGLAEQMRLWGMRGEETCSRSLGPCVTQDSRQHCAGTWVSPSALGQEGVRLCCVC